MKRASSLRFSRPNPIGRSAVALGRFSTVGMLSASIRKFVGTERCHRWMAGKDAGGDAQQRCARRRGRRPAPPGAPRMHTSFRIGALDLLFDRRFVLGRPPDSADDVLVARTPADRTRDGGADLLLGRIRIL